MTDFLLQFPIFNLKNKETRPFNFFYSKPNSHISRRLGAYKQVKCVKHVAMTMLSGQVFAYKNNSLVDF